MCEFAWVFVFVSNTYARVCVWACVSGDGSVVRYQASSAAGWARCVWVTAPAQASNVEQNSAGAAGLEPNEERRQANPRSN